jgi:hypothetical protein
MLTTLREEHLPWRLYAVTSAISLLPAIGKCDAHVLLGNSLVSEGALALESTRKLGTDTRHFGPLFLLSFAP